MTKNISWAPNANRALGRLRAFLLDRNNPAAAERAGILIDEAVKFLARNPYAGKHFEGLPESYRWWFVKFGAGGYQILYRSSPYGVDILSVKHSLEREYPGIDEIREQIDNE